MIRKLLCWLGWHEWEEFVSKTYIEKLGALNFEEAYKCKHCGKVKK